MTDTASDARDASAPDAPPQAPQMADSAAPASGASDAPDLVRELDYSLTVGQARQRFAELRRHVPAERTIQNYCVQGDIAAQKLRTTYGAEWIINAASLDAFILAQPELPSDARDASAADPAPQATQAPAPAPRVAPASTRAGDASDAALDARPVGETRRLVDVLIENARLLAQVEDRNEIITDLRRDRGFMQEQVRSAVKLSERALTQGDNLLRTLQVMRLGPGVVPNEQGSETVNRTPVDNEPPYSNPGL